MPSFLSRVDKYDQVSSVATKKKIYGNIERAVKIINVCLLVSDRLMGDYVKTTTKKKCMAALVHWQPFDKRNDLKSESNDNLLTEY